MIQPVVSVVVPTYNRAHCLSHAVDSILAQSYPRCEIIVVDDGSTDSTASMMSARYGANERVRYLQQGNAGVSAARNAGFRAASGDYVALLDSDDVWKSWKIEVQLACLQALPQVGMIWTDMEAVDPQGVKVLDRYLRVMYNAYRWFGRDELFTERRRLDELTRVACAATPGAVVGWGDIFSQMVMGNLVHTSTVLLTRERLAKVGGFNEGLHVTGEDYDFHLRTCREGPVAFIDVSSIEYQIGGADQLTHPSLTIHMAENFLKTIEPIIEHDRARIRLPNHMIRSVLAEAHGWIGSEMLKHDRTREARRELALSLRCAPLHARTWLTLLAACMPESSRKTMHGLYRRLTKHESVTP